MGFNEDTGISDDMTRELARLMKSEGNAYEQDNKLLVRFYMGSIPNRTKTLELGRPVYDDLEKIRILKVGEKDYIDKGATPDYIARFPKQYEAFKRGEEAKQSGTPLSMWPVLKDAQVKEFAALNIVTVEQLASCPDIVIQKFMGGFGMRQAAKEYVDRAVSQAPLATLQAQLDEKETKLAALTAQMEQMSLVMAGLQAQGRGGLPVAQQPAPVAPGLVAYSGPEFPVATDAPKAAPQEADAVAANTKYEEIMSGKKPRGRPPKSARAE